MLISAVLGLDSGGDGELYLHETGSRYLMTGRGSPDQTERSYFDIRKVQSLGFFVLFSGPETIYLLVWPASHICLHYLMCEKKKLVKLLRLEGVAIPAYSVFIGERYTQPGGNGCRGS